MKYLSLFSGIGGFELGIGTRAECVGYSEIDPNAIKIYEKHFPHKNYGDITTINASELPDFDLLVGGFPCQAFSIAGKRKGFDDTRGTLFFDLARILRAKQPRLFCFENVKGLLSHDNGQTFSTIISTIDELGYDCQWQVLNSKNFGVPQNRERVFIIGNSRGTPRPKVFPFGEDDRVSNEPDGAGQGRTQTEISHTLRGSSVKADQVFINQLNTPTHSNDRIYGTDGISPTLNTMQGGMRQPFIAQRPRRKNSGGNHEISPTVSSNSFQDNNHLVKEMQIRRLTPTECERLQGFPDGWTTGVSDTQRYKCLGNAVTVNTIQAIMEKLL